MEKDDVLTRYHIHQSLVHQIPRFILVDWRQVGRHSEQIPIPSKIGFRDGGDGSHLGGIDGNRICSHPLREKFLLNPFFEFRRSSLRERCENHPLRTEFFIRPFSGNQFIYDIDQFRRLAGSRSCGYVMDIFHSLNSVFLSKYNSRQSLPSFQRLLFRHADSEWLRQIA